jgi:hypothetical protein
LNTTLTPHSIIHGDACFAYFNKIRGIPRSIRAEVRWTMSRRAYEQLIVVETEIRESGTTYSCPQGTMRHIMSHAGVGGTPSAFGLVGQRRFVRA